MSNKNRIVFYLTDDEIKKLSQRAEACDISVGRYVKQLVLDDTDNVKLRKGAATTMAKLYYWSEQTTDLAGREYLKKGADLLWQSLR